MTEPPDFDELIGEDLPDAERARLRRVHELLVRAGPPPELDPHLEAGPDFRVTFGRRAQRPPFRRIALLAAALVVVGLVFLGGYLAGNTSNEFATKFTVPMRGTAAAPSALASLQLADRDEGGNWPMRLNVHGLRDLPAGGYYALYLTRGGKPVAPCGSFRTKSGAGTFRLNAPYKLKRFDGWVVTLQRPGHHEPGPIVLRTAQA